VGGWHEGFKHGWGAYCWANGASFRGEWKLGVMQVRIHSWAIRYVCVERRQVIQFQTSVS
jgi:hypothetical protein